VDVDRIAWDPRKEAINRAKHGVSFLAARTVFRDPGLRTWPDTSHGAPGRRENVLGIDEHGRLLFVVTESATEGTIRIISARRATKREAHDYSTGHR
jgi:uncharacterized DUF497 family protein